MRRLLILPALLALGLGVARADPFTDFFDDLKTEIATRLDELPDKPAGDEKKAAKALGKGQKALGKSSDSVAGDLKIAAKLARALEKTFADDAVFDGHLAALRDDFDSAAEATRAELADIVDRLVDPKLAKKGGKGLAGGDKLLAKAAAATSLSKRFKTLGKAVKKLEGGLAKTAGGELRPPEEDEVPLGETDARTLSGTVISSIDGAGIPGVTVTLEDDVTLTDADGNFILFDPPSGLVLVDFDGITADVPGARFPCLTMEANVATSGKTVMPNPVDLPDLNNPDSAVDEVMADAGATTEPIDATMGDISLTGPTGTQILLDGVLAQGPVAINVTPVDVFRVPMPIPSDLVGACFVTVQPALGSFDTGGGLGLDVTLPNDRGLPPGTQVDIISFDHDVEDWVNRSEQTGQKGVVVDVGGGKTVIQASGVITKGGWHVPVVAVNLACTTTIVGRVVDGDGEPILGALVSTGPVNRRGVVTGENGEYVIDRVPAYEAGTCDPISITLYFLTPAYTGALTTTVSIDAGDIVPAGTTDTGTVEFTLPTLGSCAGRVTSQGQGVAGPVTISGPTPANVTSNQNGAFFAGSLTPGSYEASFTFDTGPKKVGFEVRANDVTTLNLQEIEGTGGSTVTVRVYLAGDDEVANAEPAAGAKLLLVGTDTASGAGILATTNKNGEAVFTKIDGPFTVTAQLDLTIPGDPPVATRVASTVAGVTAPDGVISIPVFFEVDREATLIDSTLSGQVKNFPGIGENEGYSVCVHARPETFIGEAEIGPSGAYEIEVPSGVALDLVLRRWQAGGLTVEAILRFNVGPVPPGETLTFDFDWDADPRVALNREVDLDIENGFDDPQDRFLGLFVRDATGGEIQLPMFFSSDQDPGGIRDYPATLMLPDFSSPPFDTLIPTLDAGENAEDAQIQCEQGFSATPATVTFIYPAPATIDSPAAGSEVTVAEARSLAIEITAEGGGSGFYEIFLASEDAPAGFGGVLWALFVRPGTTSLTLPPTALPMIAGPGLWELELETLRFPTVFQFDDLFGADFESIVETITTDPSLYEASTESGFEVK